MRLGLIAAAAGLAALYTLSPLTIVVAIAAAYLLPRFGDGLPSVERRWLTAILAAALAARLVAIGVVFVRNVPTHDTQFIGATTGDEAYALSRAWRTRNIVTGRIADKYDYFVAFDEYGRSSFVDAATVLQVLFGRTPYSLRLLNVLLFTVAALILFRLARRAFAPFAAHLGLAALLFWPSLFAWSISLLKEPIYLLGGAVAVAAAVALVRDVRPLHRLLCAAAIAMTVLAMRGLRPGAVALVLTGLAIGYVLTIAFRNRRTATWITATTVVAALAIVLSTSIVQRRLVAGLEAAAKTHSGHVFTVGHSYKLLDDGFYLHPTTPAASQLTLTAPEAARFVVRAIASFVTVPAPWQLQSVRELAYLPEQLAWYALVLFVPFGLAAGLRRDALTACMLTGFVVPTSFALAVTNGNVGTLLRLRGLVIPFLIWIGVAGFCQALGTVGKKNAVRFIDDEGRVFGRFNLFDAALAAFAIVLIPIAYGTFLLFRTPAPRITSVTRVPVTREERRVAGGVPLAAKLKVRGSGLRPMLRATIDDMPAIGFVFEDPNSADVLVGAAPPGAHDLVLYDGVQEVARASKAVTIEATRVMQVAAVGTLVHLDDATAARITASAPTASGDRIIAVGPIVRTGSAVERSVEWVLTCDPDPNADGCSVRGQSLASNPPPTLPMTAASDTPVTFVVREIFPTAAPTVARVRVRLTGPAELLSLVRSGDRDDTLDARAATVADAPRVRSSDADVSLTVGLDASADGWRYRGQVIKAGTPFKLATARYVLEGTVLAVDSGTGAK